MKYRKMQMEIKRANTADIDSVMEILDKARHFMRSVGNRSQWSEGYPSHETIERDIELGHSKVCCNEEGGIVATFCFTPGPDATYAVIEDVKWLNDKPYHVIHRLVPDGSVHRIEAGELKPERGNLRFFEGL